MKQIILILVVSGFFIGCSENNINEQKFLGANGNPKLIKDTKYKAIEKFGEVTEQDIDEVLYYEFDKHGHIQKEIKYDSDGDIIYSETNTFEDGKWIESTTYHKYINEVTTTYKLKNRTSKSEIWEGKTSEGKTITLYRKYEYLKLAMVRKDFDDNIVTKIEQITDDNGNIVEYKAYEKGEVVYWYKSTFKDKSQEIERKMLSDYDKGIYTYQYGSFDKNGNWTKKIERKDEKIESITIRKITYKYE